MLTEHSLKVVAYGAGTNSTAMLIGFRDRGIIPDLILFADTGGERPETYEHLKQVSEWCVKNGFPEIITVQQVNKHGEKITLEGLCLKNKMLPSIAYGYKGCSLKHKRAPQDKYVNNYQSAKKIWKSGGKVTKFIGYDFDEQRRAKIKDDDKYIYSYPLIDWKWGRDECIEAIEKEGIKKPGKSACFFCPSSKPKEILELKEKHPELLERAVAMEKNANLTSIKGLGRNYSWGDLIMFTGKQQDMFKDTRPVNIEVDCGCYDGED